MKKVGILLGLGVLLFAGCGGGGDTTTVIKEAAPTTVEKTTTVEAPAPKPKLEAKPAADASPSPAPEPEPEPQEVPNVVGLPLPAAKQLLKQAGYRAAATNTDTAFGIIVESNYTICEQSEPRGTLVPVLAQKYGC